MVSRRNFLSIAAIMLVVFFMFQFSNIALELWNNYEDNEYAAEEKLLAGRSSAFALAVSGAGARTAWGTDRPKVALIGEADSAIRRVVTDWASYTKWDLIVSPDLAGYSPGPAAPELIVLDAAKMEWNGAVCQTLRDHAANGSNLLFASLPDVSTIRENAELRDLLGIYEVRADSTVVEGIHLYKGFLLGGEVIYRAESVEEAKLRQDLELVMPWYILGAGTKIYMKGIPSGQVDVEDHPAVIWRRSLGGSYAFAVNGSYMEDATGLGILSAVIFESSAYSVYPVVNAQNLVVANYPSLAAENGEAMERFYSTSMQGVYRDVLWPDITKIYLQGKLGLSCMMAMQFDYSDGNQPDQDLLVYYMKMMNELNAEAGLSGVSVPETPAQDKLAEDFAFMEKAQLPYKFTSFYAGGLEDSQVMDVLEREDMSAVRTVVRPYDGSTRFIGYATDRVTSQMAVSDGFHHTFRCDLRMRGVETALAYTCVLVDTLQAVYPESVDSTWGLTAHLLASNVPFFWQDFSVFDGSTVSECDERIRDFLSMDYTHSMEDGAVFIRHNNGGPAWFILRTNHQTVESVEGGSAALLENGAYLIEASEQYVTVKLRLTYIVPE